MSPRSPISSKPKVQKQNFGGFLTQHVLCQAETAPDSCTSSHPKWGSTPASMDDLPLTNMLTSHTIRLDHLSDSTSFHLGYHQKGLCKGYVLEWNIVHNLPSLGTHVNLSKIHGVYMCSSRFSTIFPMKTGQFTWRQLPVQRYVEELAATHPMLLALVIFVGNATWNANGWYIVTPPKRLKLGNDPA